MAMPPDPLAQALRRLFRRRTRAPGGAEGERRVTVAPGSAFEAVLEQRIASAEQRLEELRSRVNGLLFLGLGAVLVQVVLRVAGL